MRFNQLQIQSRQYTLQGMLMGFLPLTILACDVEHPYLHWLITAAAGLMIPVLQVAGIGMIFRKPIRGKVLVGIGMLLNTGVLWFDLINDALLTLFYAILSAAGLYYLLTARLYPAKNLTPALQLNRLNGSCWALLLLTLFSPLFAYKFSFFPLAVLISVFISIYFCGVYLRMRAFFDRKCLMLCCLGTLAAGVLICFFCNWIVVTALLLSIPALVLTLYHRHSDLEYWDFIIQHPARCLMLTFLILCGAGTLLLRTPVAMQGEISVIDAAFTAVSASCITGLSTIDVAGDLTLCGRIFLLVLIQLGGLGIMTLTTLALHALGKLSLNQELIFSEINGEQESNLFKNLRLIVCFTFGVELIGAFFLSWGFYSVHGNWAQAIELGIFTSISAYCNAVMFPGEAGLAPYMTEGMLLMVIAIEVVLGGISPLVTFSVLDMRRKRQLPFVSKLVLKSTGNCKRTLSWAL